MKSTPVCSSDAHVALARRRALSPSEWQDFAAHLATCIDCRASWRLALDFERSGGARPGDERIIARGVRATLAASARPRTSLLRMALAASVVLAVAGAASAAIVLHVRQAASTVPVDVPGQVRPAKPRASHGVSPKPQAAMESPSSPATEGSAARPVERETPLPAVDQAPPVTPSTAPKALRSDRSTASARPLPASAVLDPFDSADTPPSPQASPYQEDAAVLFEEALAERQQGRAQSAIAAFHRLEREFPHSSEATVSLVSVGDLLLGNGRPAEGLVYFEVYLRRAPAGPLAPEAWVGKARALEALGRVPEAKATWNEIAKRFTDARYLRRQHAH